MTTRSEALAHIDTFAFLAISDATSLINAIFDHVEALEAQMVEHSQIAHRALLIGEEDGWFEWKGDAKSGGWHASLHNDLIKIRDNQHIYSWVRLHNGVMDALKKENEKLKAEKEHLEKTYERFYKKEGLSI